MSSETKPPATADGATSDPADGKPDDAFKPDNTASEATADASTVAADVAQKTPADESKSSNGADDQAKTNGASTEETESARPAEAANGNGEASSADPASAKKKDTHKRRSSGVPEHKGKKSKGAKPPPQLVLDAKPGNYYWAYLKGHPAWPAIIADEEMLPENIIAQRPVTAMRPDGSYRDDYDEGGKNVKDRTYAVMYLGTYEFSWTKNTDLKPLDAKSIDLDIQGKKSKALWKAYEEAKEEHPLQHWKDMLAEFQAAIEENAAAVAEAQAQAEEKEKAKAAKAASKGKRKSKAAADEDVEMADAPGDEIDGKTSKPSKKRKKGESNDADEEKPAKTPKTTSGVKLSLKSTPNGNADSATKKAKAASSTKKTTKKDKGPELTPEEAYKARHDQGTASDPVPKALKANLQEVLYLRHKLQKGFLTRDQIPKEEEMDSMANYISVLETAGTIEAPILRDTRIAKVLRGILRLDNIPLEDKHHFKTRCQKLLDVMNKTLDENPETAGEGSKKKATSDEAKAEPTAEEAKTSTTLAATAVDQKADGAAKEQAKSTEAEKRDSAETSDEKKEKPEATKDEPAATESKDGPAADANATSKEATEPAAADTDKKEEAITEGEKTAEVS